jgi:hypothetical protein
MNNYKIDYEKDFSNLSYLNTWINQNGVSVLTTFCEKFGWKETDKPIVNLIKSINTNKTSVKQIREHKNGFSHFQMYGINSGKTEKRQVRMTTSVGTEIQITSINNEWDITGNEILTGSFNRNFIIETENLDMVIFIRGNDYYMLDNYKSFWKHLRKLLNEHMNDEYISIRLDNSNIIKGNVNNRWNFIQKSLFVHKSNFTKYQISYKKYGLSGNSNMVQFKYDCDGKIETGIFLSEKEMIEKFKSILNVKTYNSYKKMKSVKGFDGLKLDSKNQNLDISNSYILINLEGVKLLSIKIKVVTMYNKNIVDSNNKINLNLKNSEHLIIHGYPSNPSNTNQIDNIKKESPKTQKTCPKLDYELKIMNYSKNTEEVYYKMSVKQTIEDLKVHYKEGPHLKIYDSIQPDGTIMEGSDIWGTLVNMN